MLEALFATETCISILSPQYAKLGAKGARDSDGVWAKYWYDSVWDSTGFSPLSRKTITNFPAKDRDNIALQARPYYEKLHQYRLSTVASNSS